MKKDVDDDTQVYLSAQLRREWVGLTREEQSFVYSNLHNATLSKAITAIKEALAEPEQEPKCGAIIEVFGKDWRLEYMSLPVGKHKLYTQQYTYIAPTHQKPFGWKMVPIEPTNEMLKAMDECSTEGYDERLLAGHASSVYMAAVDVAPTLPQRTWVGLTNNELQPIADEYRILFGSWVEDFARAIEAKLKGRNT